MLAINPDYSFGATGIKAKDLKAVSAESHYHNGEYEEAKRALDIPAERELSPAELLEAIEAASGG